MKRSKMAVLVALGLIGVMATASYATTEEVVVNARNFNLRGRIPQTEKRIDSSALKMRMTETERKIDITEFKSKMMEMKEIDFEAMKEEMLQKKFQFIDEKVASGEITAEEGAALKEQIKEHLENNEGRGRMNRGHMKGRKMMDRQGKACIIESDAEI